MNLPQKGAHIRHQAERHRIVAPDFFRIDVDVNEPRRRDGEGIAGDPRTRRAIIEAHAEGQQHVGLPRGVVGLVMSGARHQAERERVIGVDGAKPAGGCRHRNLQPLGQPQQFVGGAAVAHALPDQHYRPLGGEQHIDRLHDAFRIGAAAAGDIAVPGFGVGRFLGGRFQEHVERNVEHHRPRASRRHRLPCLPHGERHHFAARRLEHLLAIGAYGRRKIRLIVTIEFLEGAAVELAGRHVAGHRHERNRIEEGIAERDRKVRRTRPARRERRRRPPGHAIINVGHETRDAFMMNGNGLDVVGALVQRIDELNIAVATQAENLRHLLLDQIVDDNLSTIEHVTRRHLIQLPQGFSQARSVTFGARRYFP